ncbi:MAG TPA: cell envelope integrity protein TolA [Steroidobacteraceae bacterium]|jgi:colicin import membrane protein|nr:cell envelope integrity protein TolA [Steroidobacteraceae bacterium]
MAESVRDRWLSIGMSVLLHGSLIVLLALGWWHFREPAPAPTPPIDATVVDARTLKGVGVAPTPSPQKKAPPQAQPQQPPPAPVEGPPPPTPDEVAMRQQAAKEEAEHEALAQQRLQAREAQRKAAEAAAAEQAEEAQKAEEEQAAAQAAAQAKKLAAAQKAAAKLAAKKKLAEERKLADEKKLAAQQAAAERAARVADLNQSLQEDERATAASGALASWTSEITSRIQNAWIRPPTAQRGLKCVLNVGLVQGGSVTSVSIGECNGDDAVRQSIQTAVYNASPLPAPPDGIAFPSQLIITFQPTN